MPVRTADEEPKGYQQKYLSAKQYQRIYSELSSREGHPPHLMLFAKACFFLGRYEECIKALENLPLTYSNKILYQRQAFLIKAVYLVRGPQIDKIKQIFEEYLKYQKETKEIPGRDLSPFHTSNIRDIVTFVEKSIQHAKNAGELQLQEVMNKFKAVERKTFFEGMPSYLVSNVWFSQLLKYLKKDGPPPGPISNFQILDHVFELMSNTHAKKQYLDTVVLPLKEGVAYHAVDRKFWNEMSQIFSGYQIRRVFKINPDTKQIEGGDNSIKTWIDVFHEEKQTTSVLLQWQNGLYWDKSVTPSLYKTFNAGQLKEETKNGDFMVVQPGLIYQPHKKLKYVRTQAVDSINAYNKRQRQIRKKIVHRFDLQQYRSHSEAIHTAGLEGLEKSTYMNASLQALGNLNYLSSFFFRNRFLNKLGIAPREGGSEGIVTCAYADLVKRMWFSPPGTRYVNPSLFHNVFRKKFPEFQQKKEHDAQKFILCLIKCLHSDLNDPIPEPPRPPAKSQHLISLQTSKKFDLRLDDEVKQYESNNKSKVSQVFNSISYDQIECGTCHYKSFKFFYNFIFSIDVPERSPKITVYVVEAKDLQQAKKVEVYTKGMHQLGDVAKVLRQYFGTNPKNRMIPFIYKNKHELSYPLPLEYQISDAQNQMRKGAMLFLHEVPIEEVDEELAMISYHYYDDVEDEIVSDGFPRLLVMKKVLKKKQYKDDLIREVIKTIPVGNFVMEKKQQVSDINIVKAEEDSVYKVDYMVKTKFRVRNFRNFHIDKVLGENYMIPDPDLDDLLDQIGDKKQLIDKQEKWFCTSCKAYRKAIKTKGIYSTGPYIIIHLNRFKDGKKITTSVQYPVLDLDVEKIVACGKETMKTFKYNLDGVMVHRGDMENGHYSYITRDIQSKSWYHFENESVKPISEDLLVDASAYLLFYEKQQLDEQQLQTSRAIQTAET